MEIVYLLYGVKTRFPLYDECTKNEEKHLIGVYKTRELALDRAEDFNRDYESVIVENWQVTEK